MAAPLSLVSLLKLNHWGELSMAPICALHNKSQGHFIALQHFVAAVVSETESRSSQAQTIR
jgi:hypothetical protein